MSKLAWLYLISCQIANIKEELHNILRQSPVPDISFLTQMNNWEKLTLETSGELFDGDNSILRGNLLFVAVARSHLLHQVINKYLETSSTPPTSAATHSWCY